MDYIPKPSQSSAPKPQYILVNDITGKGPEKRGPQVLTYGDGRNIKVPYAPKSNCKQCHGRGFVGVDLKKNLPLICRKCYPGM